MKLLLLVSLCGTALAATNATAKATTSTSAATAAVSNEKASPASESSPSTATATATTTDTAPDNGPWKDPAVPPPSPGTCSSIRTRVECRSLPADKYQAFLDRLKAVIPTSPYMNLVEKHVNVTSSAHGVPAFLPWHRWYLMEFEAVLGMDACYWDWGADAQAPEFCPYLMSNKFGTNGKNNCVPDSYFGSYSYQGQCPTTDWDGTNGGIGAFYSIDYVAKLCTTSKSYDDFRTSYEGTAHARIHNGLGAGMSQMTSPMNPIFFIHHANVDRHWALWQQTNPDKATDFPGSLSDQLPNYANVYVRDVMDTKAYPLCYTYANMQVETGLSTAGLNRRALNSRAYEDEQREFLEKRHLHEAEADHLVRLNKRCKCSGSSKKHRYNAPPCDTDRSNIMDLRDVKPCPSWWLKMRNLNETAVRAAEADHKKYINQLNRMPGYVSPSALYNRPSVLARMVKEANITEFHGYKDGKKFKIPVTDDVAGMAEPKIAASLRSALEKHYDVKDYDDLRDDLVKKFGPDHADYLINRAKTVANKPYMPEDDLADWMDKQNGDETDECPVYEDDDQSSSAY